MSRFVLCVPGAGTEKRTQACKQVPILERHMIEVWNSICYKERTEKGKERDVNWHVDNRGKCHGGEIVDLELHL